MRQREMGFKDYGLEEEEVKMVKDACRNIPAGSETEQIFREIIRDTNPDLEEYLYESLTQGLSYDRMQKTGYLPISKRDFYGYRRRVMARFLVRCIDDYVQNG